MIHDVFQSLSDSEKIGLFGIPDADRKGLFITAHEPPIDEVYNNYLERTVRYAPGILFNLIMRQDPLLYHFTTATYWHPINQAYHTLNNRDFQRIRQSDALKRINEKHPELEGLFPGPQFD